MPRATSRDQRIALRFDVRIGLSATTVKRWATIWKEELRLPRGPLSIVSIGKTEMRKLNVQWRGKDRPTNVLSFRYDVPAAAANEAPWGEIILCPPVIRSEAADYRRTYQQHFLALVQHGLIHLSGLDHETRTQQAIWTRREKRLTPIP